MSKGGGGIFGGLSHLDVTLQKATEPVSRYVDPFLAQAQHVVSNWMYEAFHPKAPEVPRAANLGANAADGSGGTAKAASTPVAGGTGSGVKDLVTLPPNTPEGDRMRLGQNTLLGN